MKVSQKPFCDSIANVPNPTIEYPRQLFFNFPSYNNWRKNTFPQYPQYYITTRNNVKKLRNKIKYVIPGRPDLVFTNMFAFVKDTEQGEEEYKRIIVSTKNGQGDVPITDDGLNLFPIFVNVEDTLKCAYFKLNCTTDLDTSNIYKNEDNPWHKKIKAALDAKYGEQGYLYKNESEWTEWTID